MGFIAIGLENVTVAATRVTDLPSRLDKKTLKNVDVYNTFVKLIIFTNAEARCADTAPLSL